MVSVSLYHYKAKLTSIVPKLIKMTCSKGSVTLSLSRSALYIDLDKIQNVGKPGHTMLEPKHHHFQHSYLEHLRT